MLGSYQSLLGVHMLIEGYVLLAGSGCLLGSRSESHAGCLGGGIGRRWGLGGS